MNRPGDAGEAWRREKTDELEKSKDGEKRRKKGFAADTDCAWA
jgi:hypothetical protein